MSYTTEMEVIVYGFKGILGMYSKETCNVYWDVYRDENMKTALKNLYLRYN